MEKSSGFRKTVAYYLTQPVVRLLARTAVAPDMISWAGFVITLGAAALVISGQLFIAGFAVLIAGFFDTLDGALARGANRATRFGAILDSTLDRLSEAAVLIGLLVWYTRQPSTFGVLLVGLALIGSFMVSYIRARAETAGIDCQVGLFTRAERVVVMVLGLLLSQIGYALIIALAIIVLFSFITVCQRLVYVWQRSRRSG